MLLRVLGHQIFIVTAADALYQQAIYSSVTTSARRCDITANTFAALRAMMCVLGGESSPL